MPGSPTKRKCIRNVKTRRCNKSEMANATSGECVYFRRTSRCRTMKQQKNVVDNYHRYKVSKAVKTYLNNAVFKRSAKKMRDISREGGLGLSLEDYSNDTYLRDYLVGEILELAHNYSREREESDVVSLKAVKWVIKNDPELTKVLKK